MTEDEDGAARLACTVCGETKSVEGFYEVGRGLGGVGRTAWRRQPCKDCYRTMRNDRYAAGAGRNGSSGRHQSSPTRRLALAEYSQRYDQQNGRCASCGEPARGRHRLSVDRCHGTDAIRELLCHSCNTALGAVADDPRTLRLLIAYLHRHGITETPSHPA